jgi:hypothetical protein
MKGLTFDTGALIALERRRSRISRVYTTAVEDGLIVTVPVVVVTEWWRGRSDIRERILRGLRIEPLDLALSQRAGEAAAAVNGASAVDAIVMASAARRDDIVYTTDFDHLTALHTHFPAVRVLSV